ncbi:MAG: ABC transporter permease subunit [Gemmataceae bacterium]|nr:ABC transporter permease subunit [Gemmataceae bacterium]
MAHTLISLGGIGTIVAVATVLLFLVWVVHPLFQSASVTRENQIGVWRKEAPVHIGVDEDQVIAWGLFRDGRVEVIHLPTGELLEQRKPFDGQALTAWSFAAGSSEAAFGFTDGSVRTGAIKINSRFIDGDELPPGANDLESGESLSFKNGVVIRTPQGKFRRVELALTIKEPAKGRSPSPVLRIDQSETTTGVVVAILSAAGELRLNTVREQTNLLTGETVLKLSGMDLPYQEPAGKGPPVALLVSAVGDQLYVFWKDGLMMRFDARDAAAPRVAETLQLLEGSHLSITAVQALIGKGTFLVGDSSGRVRAWFECNAGDPDTTDGAKMVCGHEFAGAGSPVTALAVSDRTRIGLAGCEDGSVRVIQVTSDRLMLDLAAPGKDPVKALALAPKEDGVVAVAGGVWHWDIDPKHPEITRRALFGKVHYEGYEAPQYMWQSSGGNDAFEPKFSLIPLIFGTVKATFYSLLFGVPLALLAALYTSEFLDPRAKTYVKPAIEMMASLPSVVLGFLAGLVFAQFVENVVPAVLAGVFTIWLSFLVGAYLWQVLPEKPSRSLARWKFLFMFLALAFGLLIAVPIGHLMELTLFGGDVRAWLNGRGSATGGLVLLLTPVAAMLTAFLFSRWISPWVRQRSAGLTRGGAAVLDLVKFAVGCLIVLLLAWLMAVSLSGLGFDGRGGFLGPYSQRNALVVGFVMGFAIIPIIYTIAEDALSAVPEHLRAGSLAAGATRWQTATHIIIPTAMSGMFSAVMIGMGRAVGETMIVLMATGNTPVMDWSIFSGFRTLSANIAVELPEAVRDSTHFRTLFLAALVLFSMTFVLNTVAEVIRLRFRRRAYQL